MSENTKSYKKKERRSALSFAGAANGSLDIDHVLQSKPWTNIEKFETSEAARIQSVLNDFDNRITQKKVSDAASTVAEKNLKSTKKFVTASANSKNVPRTSRTQNNVVVPKTTIKAKAKSPIKQASKAIKQITPGESPRSIDAKKTIRKSSQPNENIISGSIGKEAKKINMQNITNITETNIETSTPKRESPTMIGKATVKKSAVKKTTSGMKNPKTNSKGDAKSKEKHETSKKNVEDTTPLSDEKKKSAVKKTTSGMKNPKTNSKENIKSKEEHETSKKNVRDITPLIDEKKKSSVKKSTSGMKNSKTNPKENIKSKEEHETSKKNVRDTTLLSDEKKKSAVKKTTPGMENSKTNPKGDIKSKEEHKTLKKNAEGSTALSEKKNKNVDAEKLRNSLEYNKENYEQNASKSTASTSKEDIKEHYDAKASNKLKKSDIKIKKTENSMKKSIKTESYSGSNNESKCNVDKECKYKERSTDNFNGSGKKNLKKEDSANKLHTSVKSSKLSDNVKKTKCRREGGCAKSLIKSELCLRSKMCTYFTAKSKEDTKSKKAARAIHGLSRDIEVVKRKMQSIKNDLESNESSDSSSGSSSESSYSSSLSSYSTRSSLSYITFSDSSSSYSYTDCSCSCCCTSKNDSEYTLYSRDSTISSENSGDESNSLSEEESDMNWAQLNSAKKIE